MRRCCGEAGFLRALCYANKWTILSRKCLRESLSNSAPRFTPKTAALATSFVFRPGVHRILLRGCLSLFLLMMCFCLYDRWKCKRFKRLEKVLGSPDKSRERASARAETISQNSIYLHRGAAFYEPNWHSIRKSSSSHCRPTSPRSGDKGMRAQRDSAKARSACCGARGGNAGGTCRGRSHDL
jgi:hypothetical protein